MNEKERLVKYLKGISKVLNEVSKEVNKFGIDNKSLDLMKKVGSDLLFKGTIIDMTSPIKQDAESRGEVKND